MRKYKTNKHSDNYVAAYVRKCDICGKEFDIYGTNWAWRTAKNNKWFCSYSCAVKYDKMVEQKEKKKYKLEEEDYD